MSTAWSRLLAFHLRRSIKGFSCRVANHQRANNLSHGLKILLQKRRRRTMYVSRLTFHTLPGKTHEVEERLNTLLKWVEHAGGSRPRVMRTHYGSLGAPDLVFEQEVADPGGLETQIKQVTEN